jgi:hypothetical protein
LHVWITAYHGNVTLSGRGAPSRGRGGAGRRRRRRMAGLAGALPRRQDRVEVVEHHLHKKIGMRVIGGAAAIDPGHRGEPTAIRGERNAPNSLYPRVLDRPSLVPATGARR